MALLNEGAEPFSDVRGRRGQPQDRLPSQNVRLMQGLEGVIRSNEAAGVEIVQAAREMRINSERVARMGDSVTTIALGQQQMVAAITQAVSSLTRAMGSSGPTPPPGGAPAGTAPNGLPTGAPKQVPTGDYQRLPGDGGPTSTWLPGGAYGDEPGDLPTGGIPEGHDPSQMAENYARFQDGRGYSVKRLRQDTGRAIGRSISSARIGPRIGQDDNGQWMQMDEAGQVTGQASHGDLRNMRLANRVRTVGGNVAEQGVARGLMNSLPAGAGKMLGIAGGAYAVVNEGLNFAEKQRSENAYWQSVNGGDNLSGLNERMDANLFRYGQRGTMSGQQANALYRGVYETGLQGDDRQNALSMATENWKQFGMEINDSLVLIRKAAQSGQSGLVGVAEALEEVTKSAQGAGVNASAYREMFSQNYGASVGTLSGQGTAAVASGALSSAQAALGTQFGNVDTSGMFSTNTLRQFASMNGQNLTQYLGANQGQSGAANIIAAGQTQVLRIAQNALGQAGSTIIAQFKKERGISGKLSAEQANQVASQIMQSEVGRRIDAQGIIMQLQTMAGINVTDINDAIPFLIMALDGGWDPGAAAAAMVEESSMKSVDTSTISGREDLGKVLKSGSHGDAPANASSSAAAGWADIFGGKGGGDSLRSANDIYYEQARESGEYSPIIAKALQKDNSKQRFRINVGTEDKPEYREMDMKDAIRYHSDQLARGDVLVTAGDGKDTTLADSLGLSVNEDIDVKYDGAGAKKGKAYDAAAANKNGGGGVSGTVLIAATPELRRLLSITTTGDAYANSVPSSMVPGNALPTGN